MKKIFVILFTLFSIAGFSQVKQNYPQYGGKWQRLDISKGIRLPLVPLSTKDFNLAAMDSGQIYYDPTDSTLKYHTGYQFLTAGSGSGLTYPYTTNKYLNGYGNFPALNTDSITEGATNLFYTNTRARLAHSATSPATYDNGTGVHGVDTAILATQSDISGFIAAETDPLSIHLTGTSNLTGNITIDGSDLRDVAFLTNSFDVFANSTTGYAQLFALRPNEAGEGEIDITNNNNTTAESGLTFIFASVSDTAAEGTFFATNSTPTFTKGSANYGSFVRVTNRNILINPHITGGTLKITNLITKDDTTNYKPLARRVSDSTVVQFDHWPSGITPTIQQVLTAGNSTNLDIISSSTAYINYGDVSSTFGGSSIAVGGNGNAFLVHTFGGNGSSQIPGTYKFDGNSIDVTVSNLSDEDLTNILVFDQTTTATPRTWTLPDASGTIALTSDIVAGFTNLTQFVSQGNWKVFYSNGSGDVIELALGEANTVLTSNGTTSAPTFEAAGGGITQEQSEDFTGAMFATDNGDIDFTYNDATPDIAAAVKGDAITFAKMQNIATATFIGRNTAATGDPEELSIATAKTMLNLTGTNSGDQTITLTGDVTGSGTGSFAATIADNSVDGTDIALGSDAQGDVMFYDGTNWVRLAPGTSGQVLTTQGAAANVIWDDAAGGGSGTVNTGAALKAAYYPTADDLVDDWIGVEFGNTNINTKILSQATTEVALNIVGIASQSADLLIVENSGLTDLLNVQADGDVILSANMGIGTASPASSLPGGSGLTVYGASGNVGVSINNNGEYQFMYNAGGYFNIYSSGNSTNNFSIRNNTGLIAIGGIIPTARLHIKAGTATAQTAPIKLVTGTALTTPEDGAIEYHTSHLYFTIGSTRYQLDQQGGALDLSWDGTNHEVDITGGGTSAVIPFATASVTGIVSTASQTFAGYKTFSNGLLSQDAVSVNFAGAIVDDINWMADLMYNTTGTPANGIGSGLILGAETADGEQAGVRIASVATDVTTASADFDFVVRTMQAQATAVERFRIGGAGFLEVGEIAAPGTPGAAKVRIYTKADGLLYSKDDAGVETLLSNPGGAGEANTASNLGGGLANFDSKSAVDLRFNSFAAADFDLASNLITIDATKWLTITAGNAAYPANLTTNTTDVGNVGTGVDDLITYSIEAGKLANDGDYLEFTMTFDFAANANNKQITVVYGATTIYASGAGAQNDGSMEIKGTIIRTGAATQRITFSQINNGTIFTDYADYITATETLSGAVTLKATGEGTSSNDLIQKILIVKYFPN